MLRIRRRFVRLESDQTLRNGRKLRRLRHIENDKDYFAPLVDSHLADHESHHRSDGD